MLIRHHNSHIGLRAVAREYAADTTLRPKLTVSCFS
jgi:hypothetical protein